MYPPIHDWTWRDAKTHFCKSCNNGTSRPNPATIAFTSYAHGRSMSIRIGTVRQRHTQDPKTICTGRQFLSATYATCADTQTSAKHVYNLCDSNLFRSSVFTVSLVLSLSLCPYLSISPCLSLSLTVSLSLSFHQILPHPSKTWESGKHTTK